MLDEYTRECLVLRVERQLGSNEVVETLAVVMTTHGIPKHLRSDPNLLQASCVFGSKVT